MDSMKELAAELIVDSLRLASITSQLAIGPREVIEQRRTIYASEVARISGRLSRLYYLLIEYPDSEGIYVPATGPTAAAASTGRRGEHEAPSAGISRRECASEYPAGCHVDAPRACAALCGAPGVCLDAGAGRAELASENGAWGR